MDSILYWNGVALEANRRDFSNVPGTEKPAPEQGGPTLSSRALAIVHLAMYDAHAGVVNIAALPRYLATPPNPAAGASAAAAVAAAAHDCLSALFPRQQSHFDVALQAAGLTGAGVTEGFKFGQLVAKAMLNDRNSDAPAHANGYFASRAPIPRGVKIFVVVHLVAIAVISIAAGIVGEAFEEQTATNARYMRLVPESPCPRPSPPPQSHSASSRFSRAVVARTTLGR